MVRGAVTSRTAIDLARRLAAAARARGSGVGQVVLALWDAGCSTAEAARLLGISRQAAHQALVAAWRASGRPGRPGARRRLPGHPGHPLSPLIAAAGGTAAGLADAVGVRASAVSGWLRGSVPRRATVLRLLEAARRLAPEAVPALEAWAGDRLATGPGSTSVSLPADLVASSRTGRLSREVRAAALRALEALRAGSPLPSVPAARGPRVVVTVCMDPALLSELRARAREAGVPLSRLVAAFLSSSPGRSKVEGPPADPEAAGGGEGEPE